MANKSEQLFEELREAIINCNTFPFPQFSIDGNPKSNEYENLFIELDNKFNALYLQSHKDDFYWFHCSCKVYKSHFNQRLKKYLGENPDALEIDFLRLEIKKINDSNDERNEPPIIPVEDFKNPESDNEYLSFFDLKKDSFTKIKQSQERKLEFLNSIKYPQKEIANIKPTVKVKAQIENRLSNEDLIAMLVSKEILKKEQEKQFLKIISGKPKTEDVIWHDKNWQLYTLVKYFSEHGFLDLEEEQINTFIIENFEIKGNGKTIGAKQAYTRRKKRYEDTKLAYAGKSDEKNQLGKDLYCKYSTKLDSVFNK
ncbi:hypothetical protein [Labilibaculum sp.]|uniref:hypothetical protein n=1 Tax=Labilibaculum sp. TaxID=2060723 RepID=UPI00356262FB